MIRSNTAALGSSVSGSRDTALGFLGPSSPGTHTKRTMKQSYRNIRTKIMNARDDMDMGSLERYVL
jgi:hypothetical protein